MNYELTSEDLQAAEVTSPKMASCDQSAQVIRQTRRVIPLDVTDCDHKIKASAVVELADTPVERMIGLSHRQRIPEGTGMFFTKAGSYWMKSVDYPLDIAFLDKQGQILDMQLMYPDYRPDWQKDRYESKEAGAEYAVEFPGGWLDRHDVQVGDHVKVSRQNGAINGAIKSSQVTNTLADMVGGDYGKTMWGIGRNVKKQHGLDIKPNLQSAKGALGTYMKGLGRWDRTKLKAHALMPATKRQMATDVRNDPQLNLTLPQFQNLSPASTTNVVNRLMTYLHKQGGLKEDVVKARKNTNVNPSESQIASGKYQKGTLQYNGLTIKIENPKGSTRKGTSPEGVEWESKMMDDYGYFGEGKKGADGEQVDVFLGPKFTANNVFIVNQVDPKTKKFDETKVVLGAKDKTEAKKIYMRNYEKGWQGFGSIKEMRLDEFKEWLASNKATKAAFYNPSANKNFSYEAWKRSRDLPAVPLTKSSANNQWKNILMGLTPLLGSLFSRERTPDGVPVTGLEQPRPYNQAEQVNKIVDALRQSSGDRLTQGTLLDPVIQHDRPTYKMPGVSNTARALPAMARTMPALGQIMYGSQYGSGLLGKLITSLSNRSGLGHAQAAQNAYYPQKMIADSKPANPDRAYSNYMLPSLLLPGLANRR